MRSSRYVVAVAVSLALLLAGGGEALAVVIHFEDLADGTVVTNQYPEATFSSTAGFNNKVSVQPGLGLTPNFICSGPVAGGINCVAETIVDFTDPVNNLSFVAIGDNNSGTTALVDVFENGVFAGTVNVVTDAIPFNDVDLVDLSAFTNVTRIRIHSITDLAGLGWDTFTFDVVSDGGGDGRVPGPAAGLLLGLGLGLASLLRSRARRR